MADWKIEYIGEGVKSVPGLGAFANGTIASVTEERGKDFLDQPDWRVYDADWNILSDGASGKGAKAAGGKEEAAPKKEKAAGKEAAAASGGGTKKKGKS